LGVERKVLVVAIVDRPLELDPDAFGWTVLEAHERDVGLRVLLRGERCGARRGVGHSAIIADAADRRKAFR
jgi:hypothetical protein